jgi:GT2 family glycosyltransferase
MKLSIGVITYNNSTYKYLSFFLPSLKRAIDKASAEEGLAVKVFFVDNSDIGFRENYNFINKFFPDCGLEIDIIVPEKNIGFSKAYNIMINSAIKENSDAFLMLNPDTLLDEDMIINLLKSYKESPLAGAIAPKILYWDFKSNNKTNLIDSCGVGATYFNSFFDIGQGKRIGSINEKKNTFGFTGAGAILNLGNLIAVSYHNGNNLEFFDELMFMYKEDVDLSYRLQLSGYKVVYNSKAILYHDRTLSKSSFSRHSFFIKRDQSRSRSYLNQMIILLKIKKIKYPLPIRILTMTRYKLLFFYGLFFERKQLKTLSKIMPEIQKRSDNIDISEGSVASIKRGMTLRRY